MRWSKPVSSLVVLALAVCVLGSVWGLARALGPADVVATAGLVAGLVLVVAALGQWLGGDAENPYW